MDFKKNITSVLEAAYLLGYRYLTISQQDGCYVTKGLKDDTPLALNFDTNFVRKLEELNLPVGVSVEIRTVLDSQCADEVIALQAYEQSRDSKVTHIRHKPNELTAVKSTEEQYLLTLNGIVKTNPGDWIIRGVNGEEYPCDPEIFKKLYDIVE